MRVKPGNFGKGRLAERAAAACTKLHKSVLCIPAGTSVQTATAEDGTGRTGSNGNVAVLLKSVKGSDDVSGLIELIAA